MIKLGDHVLYIRSMGKALKVLAIAESVNEANTFLERNNDAAVVAEIGRGTERPLILMAGRYDPGEKIGRG